MLLTNKCSYRILAAMIATLDMIMHLTKIFLATVLAFTFAATALADYSDPPKVEAGLKGAGKVPFCDNGKVLKKITKKFAKSNVRYNDPSIAFTQIEHIRETSFLENPTDQNDRRFCKAHVHLTNGTHPTMYYLIQEHEGIASLRWGVEYCVSGHDFERAHGARCRSLKAPF